MAAKYWPRKAATDEAFGFCDAPAPTVTALPSEELGGPPDGPSAGAELLWPDAEGACAEGVIGAE
jgi:hypothetical protein